MHRAWGLQGGWVRAGDCPAHTARNWGAEGMKPLKIIIPGQTIAKKNSQRIIRMGRARSIRPSKVYDLWQQAAILELLSQNIPPVARYPIEVRFFFYRRNKRTFDLDNMICGSLDALQKAGVIADDTMRHVIPVIQRRAEGYGWAIDAENPRTELEIVEVDE